MAEKTKQKESENSFLYIVELHIHTKTFFMQLGL